MNIPVKAIINHFKVPAIEYRISIQGIALFIPTLTGRFHVTTSSAYLLSKI